MPPSAISQKTLKKHLLITESGVSIFMIAFTLSGPGLWPVVVQVSQKKDTADALYWILLTIWKFAGAQKDGLVQFRPELDFFFRHPDLVVLKRQFCGSRCWGFCWPSPKSRRFWWGPWFWKFFLRFCPGFPLVPQVLVVNYFSGRRLGRVTLDSSGHFHSTVWKFGVSCQLRWQSATVSLQN